MMLKEILAEFRQATTPLCAADLNSKLAVETSALEGMLQTLVQSGQLIELEAAAGACHVCPVRGGCLVMSYGVPKRYMAASPARRSNSDANG